MVGCGCRRRRAHGQLKSNVVANPEVAPPSPPTRTSGQTAKNVTACPELVDVSSSASLKGSGAGKTRASDAKARRARHVGSMSLDEKLRLLEEVTAVLNKKQEPNGSLRYLPVSKHGLDTGPHSGRSGVLIQRHSSVPPSTPEGGSDLSDIEMTDFESDGIDESIEMPPTEIYDSDTDVVQPAGELKRVSIRL